MSQQDSVWWLLAVIVFGVLAVLLLIHLVIWWIGFQQERKRLEVEIRRSSGSERRYWIAKKRRLWRSFFSFVRHR